MVWKKKHYGEQRAGSFLLAWGIQRTWLYSASLALFYWRVTAIKSRGKEGHFSAIWKTERTREIEEERWSRKRERERDREDKGRKRAPALLPWWKKKMVWRNWEEAAAVVPTTTTNDENRKATIPASVPARHDEFLLRTTRPSSSEMLHAPASSRHLDGWGWPETATPSSEARAGWMLVRQHASRAYSAVNGDEEDDVYCIVVFIFFNL